MQGTKILAKRKSINTSECNRAINLGKSEHKVNAVIYAFLTKTKILDKLLQL